MMDKMTEVLTSRYLESVVVNAGGTGHAVGDIIEIDATGATSTIVAQLEVTSVSAGVIDGIRVYRSGAYTVDPTTTTANAQSGTSGSGINATFDLTMSAAKWAVNRRTQEAASATVSAAGTGYNIGDILTVVDGSAGVRGDVDTTGTVGSAATFTVATLTGGAGTGVATVTLTEPGNYEETPTNDAATTNDGSGNDACTLTVTWQDATFANNENQVMMLEGEGSAGTDEIHLIIKSYTLVTGFDTAYNWALMGATGYNALLPIQNQAGVNNSDATHKQIDTDGGLPTGDNGTYMVLKPNDADPDMEWWLNWTGRRITLVVKVEGSSTTQYSSCYMGFINQTATSTEYPYPLVVISGTTDRDRLWTESTLLSGGIVESISNNSGDPNGPVFLRLPDGTWEPYAAEGSSSSSVRNVEAEWGVYPFHTGSTVSSGQVVGNSGLLGFAAATRQMIPPSGVPGTENVQLKPTPGTGDDYYWLVPPTIIRQESSQWPDYRMWGEIDGVFWFSRGGNTIVSEDRFVLGTKRYTIFQNGNRTQNWSYFALDED